MRTTALRFTLLFGMVLLATGLMVACSGGSGGGSKTVPAVNPGAPAAPSQQTAKTTLSISIPNDGQLASTNRRAAQSTFTSASIVVRYALDSNPANAPSDPFDFPVNSSIATGTPVNISTGAGANCSTANGTLTCAVPVTLPVGVLDVFVLDYDGQNGNGSLMYGSVTTLQFNGNGTFNATSASTASSINPLEANPVCGVPSPSPSPTESPVITEFTIPGGQFVANGLTNGPDGNVWFTATAGATTGSTFIYGYITPTGSIKEFSAVGLISPYPASGIGQIAPGAAGTLWFSYTVVKSTYEGTPNTYGAYLIQVSTAGTVLKSLTENTACNFSNAPPMNCATFDVLEPGAAGTVLTSLEYPGDSSEAPSSNLYTLTASGSLTSFYPNGAGNADLLQVTDGVWASWPRNIVRCYDPTVCGVITFIAPGGSVTSYPLPANYDAVGYGYSWQDLTVGPDGAPWIALTSTNESSALGRIGSNGSITLFPVANVEIGGITTGSDDALWFTDEYGANAIGRMTTSGTVTSYPIPTASSYPTRIVSGSNGTLWFIETGASKIGKVSY